MSRPAADGKSSPPRAGHLTRVLGPLGEVRALVESTEGGDLDAGGLLPRLVLAAGLPSRDAVGRPVAYRLRRVGPRTVQLLPRLTAAASPRLRRLSADHQLILDEFTGHPHIHVQPGGGVPPERYFITYRIKGVETIDAQQRPVIREHHVAEIYLHNGYPREKPKCMMHTPIFHPNITSFICIADYWAPGETLVDIIVHIGRMIQYQTYNPDSPLDARAARWAREHAYLFPIGREPLYMPEPEIRLGGQPAQPPEAETPRAAPPNPPKPPETETPPDEGTVQLWFE